MLMNTVIMKILVIVLRGNIEASFDGDSSEEVSGNKVTLNAEGLNFLIYGDVESGSVPQICISKDGKLYIAVT